MPGNESKPTLFVGSSSEGLDVAQAVQVQLSDVADVELWNEGVLGLGYGTLEALVKALNSFDFAVLVFTPDDLVISHDTSYSSARDNVLIEAGLFIGRLGRERTFLLSPADAGLKMPSDFAGITFANFSFPQDRTRLIHAVGPACVKIRNVVRSLGRNSEIKLLAEKVDRQAQKVDTQAVQLSDQQEIIDQLVRYSMSASIFTHLCGIALLWEYRYYDDDNNRRELYFLRDNGFIQPRGRDFLSFDGSVNEANLVDIAEPTPIGWLSVRLRKPDIPGNMLQDRRNLRIDPSTLR